MYLGISFSTTQFELARKHWNRQPAARGAVGTGVGLDGLRPGEKGSQPFTGGKLIVIDWPRGKIVWEMDLDAATGFVFEGDTLFCNNMRSSFISVVDAKAKKEKSRITNPEFNDLHSLEPVGDRFLVSSSGIDAIVEVDRSGKTHYSWWATEHGLDKLHTGEVRHLARDVDHSELFYPTLTHTVHPNSALPDGDDNILMTLFHLGVLVRLDRKTGACRVLTEGLDCPHGIKPLAQGGWTLPDSRHYRVLLLDEAFQVVDHLEHDFGWVQDATPLPNGHVIVADANHNRLVEISVEDHAVVHEFSFDKNWRVYQVSLVEWTL